MEKNDQPDLRPRILVYKEEGKLVFKMRTVYFYEDKPDFCFCNHLFVTGGNIDELKASYKQLFEAFDADYYWGHRWDNEKNKFPKVFNKKYLLNTKYLKEPSKLDFPDNQTISPRVIVKRKVGGLYFAIQSVFIADGKACGLFDKSGLIFHNYTLAEMREELESYCDVFDQEYYWAHNKFPKEYKGKYKK